MTSGFKIHIFAFSLPYSYDLNFNGDRFLHTFYMHAWIFLRYIQILFRHISLQIVYFFQNNFSSLRFSIFYTRCNFKACHSNHVILYLSLYPCASVSHFRSMFTYLQFAFFKSRPSTRPLRNVILLIPVFHPRISWRAIDESALKTHTRPRLRVSWSLSVTSAAAWSRPVKGSRKSSNQRPLLPRLTAA